MIIHALLLFVAWWLLRKSFNRAVEGEADLNEQRAFWPLVIVTLALGGSLVIRMLLWLWSHGSLLLVAGIVAVGVIGVALWFKQSLGSDSEP